MTHVVFIGPAFAVRAQRTSTLRAAHYSHL